MKQFLLVSIGISLFLLDGAPAKAESSDFQSLIQAASKTAAKGFKAVKIAQESPSESADSRCRPESETDPKIYSSDFKWGYTLPEMKARFQELYRSPKRLPKRAYWNEKTKSFELPYDSGRGGPVVITQALIQAVARHIERAYELDYIDAVFFPDMGHSHLLVPKALWDGKYSNYEVREYSQLYAGMLSDPQVNIFYHTAEQLTTREKDGSLVADPRTQWRYKTRNIAGPITADAELMVLQNPDSRANTVNGAPGYFWWGAGFDISANENGCFSYKAKGETYRFDISLEDPAPDPSSNTGAGDY